MARVLVLMGSNVDKESNLPRALALLAAHAHIELVATSPTYATVAIGQDGGAVSQPGFHNAAALLETTLSPEELRQELRAMEAQLGRVRTADRFAPRTIDLDIALYDDVVVRVDGRQIIPDPDILRFAHVAIPLAAVAPDWVHPQTGGTLAAIAQTFDEVETEQVR
ncbi:MAG: 2-amino-4-hydroxy-6-hydroxymethyldihydropteridine diphosphokinase [Caldilineaceae bacterium]|nr:2-amino-4-hydroxy-6-hydroxymethyldihydropteridine diphosphokinase [Caldilineaceae bacterium]